MAGLNDDLIVNKKFVQIVSCNTHSLAAIINLFCRYNNDLVDGDFVIVRRSEDLGNHQRLVSAYVVSRHLDESLGTHHSIDVNDLYKTKNIELNVQSSDITTPSQLLHTVRFNLTLSKSININDILNYFPRKHVDRTSITPINKIVKGNVITIVASVETYGEKTIRKGKMFQVIVSDGTGFVTLSWFKGGKYLKRIFINFVCLTNPTK